MSRPAGRVQAAERFEKQLTKAHTHTLVIVVFFVTVVTAFVVVVIAIER